MELWKSGVAAARGAARAGARAEAEGWDGLSVVDSQNLSGDPYVALAMAATTTSSLGLCTAVTNNVTRHAAVTAAAIESVQRISDGRAYLGIGRGDSALAHLGRSPSRLAPFERYCQQLQTYLSGGSVPFGEIDIPLDLAPPMDELRLAEAPPASKINWMGGGPKKVPVEIAASGPKVIAIAARHADRVMFTLGADVERLAWGIETARKARAAAGLDPATLRYGAYLQVGCHPDLPTARNIVRGGLTTHVRFSVMHGTASGPLNEQHRAVMEDVHRSYDMRKHTHADSQQAGVLTNDFIDKFAIVGLPDRVIERLQELEKLGLDKVIISNAARGANQGEAKVGQQLLVDEVVRPLRAARG